jgi:hypothetical protein
MSAAVALARDDLLALLVLRPELEVHQVRPVSVFRRALGDDLATAGDRIAEAHQGREAHAELSHRADAEPVR